MTSYIQIPSECQDAKEQNMGSFIQSLEVDGPVTSYDKLFMEIYERIRAGDWLPDQRMLSERALCERYGVSRITVRRALEKAERHGLVVRVSGRGTFVARPRISQELSQLQTFRTSLTEHSLTPSQRVLGISWSNAEEVAAEKLGVPPSSSLMCVDLLGLGDGRPMSLYRSILTAEAAKHVEAAFTSSGEESRSTYEIAATAFAVDTVIAEQVFESAPLNGTSAQLLEAPIGSAALRASSLFKTEDDRVIEWRVALYPSDRYTFRAVRQINFTHGDSKR